MSYMVDGPKKHFILQLQSHAGSRETEDEVELELQVTMDQTLCRIEISPLLAKPHQWIKDY